MKLLLSPHCDDETLFASYTLLRHRPNVLICFNGRRARHLPTNDVREAETAAAMDVFGCKVVFCRVQCDPADWQELEDALKPLIGPKMEQVWAPLPELGGNLGHNGVGNLAAQFWPEVTTFYTTYSGDDNGRSEVGAPVAFESSWPELKQQALECYESQSSKPDTAFHFSRSLREYERFGFVPPRGPRLNLGGAINPVANFDNLDKSTGWLFEEGLPMHADNAVEAITISHSLMYVELELWPSVLAELHRVLVPGGFVRITEDDMEDPNSERYLGRAVAPANRMTTGVVLTGPTLTSKLMSEAGFDVHQLSPNVSLFYDTSLIQQHHGQPPDVFHLEGIK